MHIINKNAIIDAIRLKEQVADPDAPNVGFRLVYVKDNGTYEIDSDGVVTGPFGAGGGGSPGGSDKNIQYNNSGSFGGISNNSTGTKKYLQQVSSGVPSLQQVADADLSTTDITTNNVSTSKHGFTPKLPNDATKYLDGTGAYSTPSGGGGGTYPVTATLWRDEDVVTVGNALISTVDAAQLYAFTAYQNAAANGDTFTHKFFLAAGTYTLSVLGITASDAGKIDWYLDAEGSPQISGQDWYAGGTTRNVIQTASITVTGSGVHTLKGVLNGKNGSSTNFFAQLTKMWIR